MDIKIEGDDLVIAELNAFPARTKVALARAINRAINSGRSVLVKAIAADMQLKQKDVRDAVKVQPAVAARTVLVARLSASLNRIPLIKFNAKGPEPSRGRGRGVTARLGGSKTYPNAFIATMKSGHRGVYTRAGGTGVGKSAGAWSKNLPVRELHGPSIGHVFAKHRPKALARAEEVFVKNFDHEMKFAGGQLIDE